MKGLQALIQILFIAVAIWGIRSYMTNPKRIARARRRHEDALELEQRAAAEETRQRMKAHAAVKRFVMPLEDIRHDEVICWDQGRPESYSDRQKDEARATALRQLADLHASYVKSGNQVGAEIVARALKEASDDSTGTGWISYWIKW